MKFQLKRIVVHDYGAFGVLCFDQIPFAVTLERTFDPDNRIVIPTGISRCKYSYYHKGKYPTYEIKVAGHSRVLFHKGNKELHSKGCILVAESYHKFGKTPGIANSAGGFNEFMSLTRNVPEFELEVT